MDLSVSYTLGCISPFGLLLLLNNKARAKYLYMSIGMMKDYAKKLRDLHASKHWGTGEKNKKIVPA